MKPYIFNYSQRIDLNKTAPPIDMSTVITENIEPADIDDILSCSTLITKSLENSDIDNCLLASPDTTIMTFTIEKNDEDMGALI